MRGSSPLARGLRGRGGRLGLWLRIIPARAGFTSTVSAQGGILRDHPRSRGVYVNLRDHMDGRGGSSPLARGLPQEPQPPAYNSPDHPRSRGVYGVDHVRCVGLRGSSPLARGLQDPVPVRGAGLRIIPARAGFTGGGPWRVIHVQDHPRSRGVYPVLGPQNRPCAGSSPLARGLPMWPSLWMASWMDHPRSRGVYCGRVQDPGLGGGSSPLARGLRGPGPGRR